MRFTLFLAIFASVLVTFTSASAASDTILKDIKGIKNDVLNDLKRDIDNCEKDEDNKSDFVDCVKDQLNDYDSNEISKSQKRDIKSNTKDYDFKKSRSGPGGKKNLRA